MVFLNANLKRYLPLSIAGWNILMFWGILNAFMDINASTNIAQTGVTLGFVTGALNLFLWWMLYKRRVS